MTKKLSLNEIAERLSLPKTTVYTWIADLPLGRPRRENPHPGTRAMQRKYKRLREAAYKQGLEEYDTLIREPTFRDFVVLYIAEGYKRNRNRIAIGNSDPHVVALSARWLRRLTEKPLTFAAQYHADQRVDHLRAFWSEILGVEGSTISLQRKSNSGQLTGRTWRSQHGVLTVGANDTLLRARLQAWMDQTKRHWVILGT